MWVRKIFAREFGTSDVQSNYSRLYSWMANQLGHMTLGLATVLMFFWIADTISATARLIINWSAPLQAADEACNYISLCMANNALLIATSLIILGLITVVCTICMIGRTPEISPDIKARYRPIAIRIRKVSPVVLFALMVIALITLLYKAFSAEDPARFIEMLGAATASFVIAAGILAICEDVRYFAFGLIASFGAFWITTGGAGFGAVAHGLVAVALALAFCFYIMAPTIRGEGAAGNIGLPERVVQSVLVIGLTLWFSYSVWNGLEPDWRMAIGAAIASCALWGVKEFGSDIPNVHQEIVSAIAQRPMGVLGECRRVEEDYLRDAQMDSRTDGMFYIAGAWIGAGVLSKTPVMTETSWETGSEMLGLLIFLGTFLWMGKSWAFRQEALDLASLSPASRLAVFHAALRIVILPPSGRESGGRPDYLEEPLDALFDYSKQFGHQDFDHLLIFGARGSGRSPLGRAIASEAAIADLPTLSKLFEWGGNDPRRALFISADRLAHFLRDIHKPADLRTTPPFKVAVNWKKDAIARAGAGAPAKGEKHIDPADMVVIDSLDPAALASLDELTANLSLADDQVTVWLIQDDRFDPTDGCATQADIDEWEPDYRVAEREIATLRAALTVEGKPAPKIAVGFTRRFASPAQR